jgi:PKD repeat protein
MDIKFINIWYLKDDLSCINQMKKKKFQGKYVISLMLTMFSIVQLFATAPDANFSVDNTTPVVNQSVTFTDTSDPGDATLNAWDWNFGSGASPATASGQGPHNVSYTTTGQKNVSLTVHYEYFGDRTNTETKNNYINVQPIPAPTVSGFNPTSACSGSGASVVITGTNFTGATAVKFNGTDASSFTENSATQITATLPPGATTGPISVTAPGGTGTSSSNFTVNPLPFATITSKTEPSCYGYSDGSISVQAGGGTAPYQFSNDNGATYPSGSNPYTFSGLSAANYKIRVKDNNGCESPSIP